MTKINKGKPGTNICVTEKGEMSCTKSITVCTGWLLLFVLLYHHCPGVLSRILMVNYIKEYFLLQSPDDRYFVLTVKPFEKLDLIRN